VNILLNLSMVYTRNGFDPKKEEVFYYFYVFAGSKTMQICLGQLSYMVLVNLKTISYSDSFYFILYCLPVLFL
jgi:carbonic anhydrase